MKHHSRWLAGISAGALALLMAGTAFGYSGEVAAAVTVAGPGGTLKCAVNLTITATVVDSTGKPISGQPVSWSWQSRVSSSDVIKTTTSTTNSSGVAKTTVVLACAPGTRRIRATADAVSGTAVLNLTGAGLPNTSTLPAESRDPAGTSGLGAFLAAMAIAAGCLIALRRVVLYRR